jgi:hypothetical protein
MRRFGRFPTPDMAPPVSRRHPTSHVNRVPDGFAQSKLAESGHWPHPANGSSNCRSFLLFVGDGLRDDSCGAAHGDATPAHEVTA